MKQIDATENSYKNGYALGYAKGYEDGKRDAIAEKQCKTCLHKRKYGRKPPACFCLLYDRETSEEGFCDKHEPMPDNRARAYQVYGKGQK